VNGSSPNSDAIWAYFMGAVLFLNEDEGVCELVVSVDADDPVRIRETEASAPMNLDNGGRKIERPGYQLWA
jgi:hypothetical protein